MSAWVWFAIALAVIVVAVIVAIAVRESRSRRLKQRFGPEYDRTVSEAPTRREAESLLSDREKRRRQLDIRPLAPAARDRYEQEWLAVQSRFVDDPESAVGDADALVQRVMAERGYPTTDFDERAELVSVDHPVVVENYRAAHGIHDAHGRGEAGTEDLRQAMVHYRALFEELLETGDRVTTAREEA